VKTRTAVGAAIVAGAFGLGLWTRPASTRPVAASDAASLSSEMASPTRIGSSRVVPRGTVRVAPDEGRRMPEGDGVLTRLELGESMREVFAEQVRDDAWAVPVERFLGDEVRRFFALVIPEAEDVAIECRESMCKMSFVVPAERERIAYGRQQALPLGDVLQPWREELDDGRVRVGMYVAYGADTHPPERIAAYYRDQYAGRFPMPPDELRGFFERDEARMAEEESR
jgi:hypothetical protein